MRITQRQLRKLVREVWAGPELELQRLIRSAVTGILSGMFLSGRELVAKVMNELTEFNPTEDDVFKVLDDMIDNGDVALDVEEDEWSLP